MSCARLDTKVRPIALLHVMMWPQRQCKSWPGTFIQATCGQDSVRAPVLALPAQRLRTCSRLQGRWRAEATGGGCHCGHMLAFNMSRIESSRRVRGLSLRRCPGVGRPAGRSRGHAQKALRGSERTPRTVTRKVNAIDPEEYANTPERRYINFTGFPFPIGPIAYRKTTCREV